MKPFPIMNVGEHGIISDLPDFQLPDNAWSAGENIRFFENRATSAGAYASAFTPSVAPYFIDHVGNQGNIEFVYAGLDDIYTYDGASHTKRTRNTGLTVYTGLADDIWNGGTFHGWHALTNGVDAPQFRLIGSANNYEDMNYDVGAGTTWTDENKSCKLLVPMKFNLVAMDLDYNGTRYPQRVHWCDPADAGTFATDWDVVDTTNRAGHHDLVGSNEDITTALGMAESVIIYTGDMAHRMDWVGGAVQFDFNALEWSQGSVSPRGACLLPGGFHFVVASYDIYVHNGHSHESVVDEKRRRFIFENVSADNYRLLFVVPNYRKHEVMVCVPLSGDTLCTRAHVYNYKRKSWGYFDIPNLMDAKQLLDPQADATPWKWSDMTATTWNEMTFPWGGEGYNPLNRSVIAASPDGSGDVLRLDDTFQAGGTNVKCRLERTGLNIGGGKHKIAIKRMIPQITGGPVTLQVGGQDTPGGPVTWSTETAFDPATQKDATFWGGSSGVYNCIRIKSEANVQWELRGMILFPQVVGGV